MEGNTLRRAEKATRTALNEKIEKREKPDPIQSVLKKQPAKTTRANARGNERLHAQFKCVILSFNRPNACNREI